MHTRTQASQRPWAVHTTHAVATATVISVAASLACTFDDISLFSMFHGGFASLSIGLLIPAICYLRLVVDGNYRNSSYALLLLGFAFIFCAIVALMPRLSLQRSDVM
jgi:hypothetical protein